MKGQKRLNSFPKNQPFVQQMLYSTRNNAKHNGEAKLNQLHQGSAWDSTAVKPNANRTNSSTSNKAPEILLKSGTYKLKVDQLNQGGPVSQMEVACANQWLEGVAWSQCSSKDNVGKLRVLARDRLQCWRSRKWPIGGLWTKQLWPLDTRQQNETCVSPLVAAAPNQRAPVPTWDWIIFSIYIRMKNMYSI